MLDLRQRADSDGHLHNDTKGATSTSQHVGVRVHDLALPIDNPDGEDLFEAVAKVGRKRTIAAIGRPPDVANEMNSTRGGYDALSRQFLHESAGEDAAADPGRRFVPLAIHATVPRHPRDSTECRACQW